MTKNQSSQKATANAAAETEDTFSLCRLLSSPIDQVPMLIEPILPRVGLGALVGGSDCGKSMLLRCLAAAVASGQPFLEWQTSPLRKRVLYFSTEDSPEALASLCKRQNKGWKLTTQEAERVEFVFSAEEVARSVEEKLTAAPADLVIIDSFADVCTGDLNQSSTIRQTLGEFAGLAVRHKCLILFLHHTGKGASQLLPSKNNIVGSQSFEAKMRTVIELRPSLKVERVSHLCFVKANYLDKSFKKSSFDIAVDENLNFQALGTRTPIEDIEVENQTTEPKPKKSKAAKAVKLSRDERIISCYREGKSVESICSELHIARSYTLRVLEGEGLVNSSDCPPVVSARATPPKGGGLRAGGNYATSDGKISIQKLIGEPLDVLFPDCKSQSEK